MKKEDKELTKPNKSMKLHSEFMSEAIENGKNEDILTRIDAMTDRLRDGREQLQRKAGTRSPSR